MLYVHVHEMQLHFNDMQTAFGSAGGAWLNLSRAARTGSYRSGSQCTSGFHLKHGIVQRWPRFDPVIIAKLTPVIDGAIFEQAQ